MPLPHIRVVTDDEVAHVRDHGWVKLDQLIAAEGVAQLLERAKVHMGSGGDQHAVRHGTDTGNVFWNDRHNIADDDEAFAAVCYSPQMGSTPSASCVEMSACCRRPTCSRSRSARSRTRRARARSRPPTTRTPWTCRSTATATSSFWIALDHITVNMGGMRFVDRSHALGMLGLVDLDETYPELHDMTVTDVVELAPGDATVHTMYTIHGTDANETASPRWGLIVGYIPEDAMYTGGFAWSRATLAWRAAAELRSGDRFGAMLRKVYG